jgi:DNA gyrase subunit A
MITARGKLQRIVAGDVSVIGRNTQGVRIMSMDEADTLAAIVRVPREEEESATTSETSPTTTAKPTVPEATADPFESADLESPAEEDDTEE